jgi:hypothetical protein
MLSAITIKPIRGDFMQGQQQQPVERAGQSCSIAAGNFIDDQAQQQVAALGALVAVLLQLQVINAVVALLPLIAAATSPCSAV